MVILTGCATTNTPLLYKYHRVEPEVNNIHFKIIPIYIDKSFNSEELTTITAVVNEWNYVLNHTMRLEIDRRFIDHNDSDAIDQLKEKIKIADEGIMIVGVDHDHELVSDVIEDSDGTLAYVNDVGLRANFMAVIRDRIGHRNLHKILLHEFGHALGGRHVETMSLMYPYVNHLQTDCVDKITAAQVATYHGLTLRYLNYCSIPNFD